MWRSRHNLSKRLSPPSHLLGQVKGIYMIQGTKINPWELSLNIVLLWRSYHSGDIFKTGDAKQISAGVWLCHWLCQLYLLLCLKTPLLLLGPLGIIVSALTKTSNEIFPSALCSHDELPDLSLFPIPYKLNKSWILTWAVNHHVPQCPSYFEFSVKCLCILNRS